jgi:hypothetical protein
MGDRCEVCGDPVVDLRKLPVEIRSKVYKPDQEYNVEVNLDAKEVFGESESE